MNRLIKIFYDKTFFKILMVGVINTCIGYGTTFVMYNVFLFNYWISTSFSNMIAIIVSFFLNKNITFKSKVDNKKSFLKFILVAIVCYIIAYSLSKALINKLFIIILDYQYDEKIVDNISIILGMCIYTVLNYIGQRFIVFKTK